MKMLRHYRILSRRLGFLVAVLLMSFTTDELNDANKSVAPAKGQTIMLALLLDTSNRFIGIIEFICCKTHQEDSHQESKAS